MEQWTNNNAKTKYIYNFTWYNDLKDCELIDALLNHQETNKKSQRKNALIKKYTVGGKKYGKSYFDMPCSFDIETSTYWVNDTPYSTMYCWQFGVNDTVIMGHTYDEFIELLSRIKDFLKPSKKQRLLVAIHNMSYEFSFVRDWLNITDSFLKEQRRPLTIEHDDFILFIDTFAITQNSLKKLAEAYTNTQKCVGDLDYNLIRLPVVTPLTREELGYCHNDVLILTEFMRYYNDTYLNNHKRPMTATGILNDEIQTKFEEFCEEHEEHKGHIQNAQPSEQEYLELMNWCYRGGYTHGRMYEINEILESTDDFKLMGVDYTSSYPSVMLYRRYPRKMRKNYTIKTLDDVVNWYNKDYAIIFKATFYNVRNKLAHSIESKSKCIELVNPVIDNGRILSCDKMTVYISMLDAFNYMRFYTWTRCEIYDVLTGKMDDTLEYKLAKARVNSFYGLTVKRVPLERVTYIDGQWLQVDSTSYDKQVEKKALLPYYGIFVSAWARYNLLQSVADLEELGVPCFYMDTDSIKTVDNATSRKYFDDYNNNIKRMTEDAKKRTGATDLIDGLGEFDIEYGEGTKNGAITKLKILGAKRYILTTDKGHNLQTIAGLPKGWLFDKINDKNSVFYGKDPFKVFTNKMIAEDCKLASKYTDEPFTHECTDYLGNNYQVFEKSCVSLVDTNFKMSLDDAWLNLLASLSEDARKCKRVI